MKRIPVVHTICLLALLIHPALAGLSSGPYSDRPVDIPSSASLSSSGLYLVGSSSGQAGGVETASSGPYELRAGFWGGIGSVGTGETPTPTMVLEEPTATPTLDADQSGRIDSIDLLTALQNLKVEGAGPDLLLLLGVHWYRIFP
jgi:hypothetical protein